MKEINPSLRDNSGILKGQVSWILILDLKELKLQKKTCMSLTNLNKR